MIIQDQIATKERMVKWGFNGGLLCQFCRSRMESRENFFCSYYPFLEGFGQPFVEGACMTKWWDDRMLTWQLPFIVLGEKGPQNSSWKILN